MRTSRYRHISSVLVLAVIAILLPGAGEDPPKDYDKLLRAELRRLAPIVETEAGGTFTAIPEVHLPTWEEWKTLIRKEHPNARDYSLLEAITLAAYLPETGKIVVNPGLFKHWIEGVAEGKKGYRDAIPDGFSFLPLPILAHEMTHALDEQQYQLTSRFRNEKDSQKKMMLKCLVEGHATLVEERYVLRENGMRGYAKKVCHDVEHHRYNILGYNFLKNLYLREGETSVRKALAEDGVKFKEMVQWTSVDPNHELKNMLDDKSDRSASEKSLIWLRSVSASRFGEWTSDKVASVEDLDFAALHVTDDDMRHLAGFPRLKRLDLAATKVSADGLAHIEAIKTLEFLRVDRALVDTEKLSSFRKSHPQCRIDLFDKKQAEDAAKAREWWEKMREEDERLREQFKKIVPGMTPDEVRHLMGVDPTIMPIGIWGFKLSEASNRANERNWTLLVIFENGKVSKTEESYTCIETRPRQ